MSTFTIMATKANPDRARAAGMGPGCFQISHWVAGEGGIPQNMSALDSWVPSMEDAVQWVAQHYPTARVSKVRTDVAGHKVVVSYTASLEDLGRH